MKFISIIRRISIKIFRFFFPLRVSNLGLYQNNLENLSGIEIGGPSKLFEKNGFLPLYHIIENLDCCNFSRESIWEGKIEHGNSFRFGNRNGTQYIAEASDLQFIQSNTYDFLLSSHCLEHLANPIKALKEWIRIVKDDGYLLIILPHKEGTFDRFRPVTPLCHFIEDYENNVGEDDTTHFNEILELHDFSRHPESTGYEEFKARTEQNYYNRCVHHHVFDMPSALLLFRHLNLKVLDFQFVQPFNIVALLQKN